MFSVSPAEILTIAVVALVVFGPKRLPELSRRAGKVLRELKEAADDLRRGIESEVGPQSDLGDVRRELRGLLDIFPSDPPVPPLSPPIPPPTPAAPPPDDGPAT